MRPVLALMVFLSTAVLAPSRAGAAAFQDENRLGLFYDTAATIYEIETSPNTQHNLYIVLLDPVNDEFGGGGRRDVAFVLGFECGIEPPPGDFLLDVTFPVPAVNLGDASNITAGFVSGVPVGASRAVTLATVSVLAAGNNPEGYQVVPASPPSHAGTMAYLDAEDPDDNIVDMIPVSGQYGSPVFWFGDWHVEEVRQWGDLKALFH